MTKINVKIKIEEDYHLFEYNGDLDIPVTTLLDRLNYPIEYDCSCLQGLCGSCAMVINSVPKLGCKTIVSHEIDKNSNLLTIEPLSKFPLIKDLKVDRSILFDAMKDSQLWLESDAKISNNINFEYEMSLCLICGCCTEVCPNYNMGDFSGTHAAVLASKLINQEKNSKHLKEIKNNYKKKFFPHCVKSLACETICPMGIETQRAISKMNKKSVWKILQLNNHD